jgi:hypothetical protein
MKDITTCKAGGFLRINKNRIYINMTNQLFLKPDEWKFLSLAVVDMLERLSDAATNQQANWTPEARKDLKEMVLAGKNLRIKLAKLGFDVRDLPPFLDSDWDEFFTKQS